MSLGPEWRDLGTRLKLFVIWFLSLLIDTGFFVLWVIIQFSTNDYVIHPLQSHLPDIEKLFLSAFQIVFAVGTFIVIAAYIYVDIRKIILQARKAIRDEQNRK